MDAEGEAGVITASNLPSSRDGFDLWCRGEVGDEVGCVLFVLSAALSVPSFEFLRLKIFERKDGMAARSRWIAKLRLRNIYTRNNQIKSRYEMK